MHACTACKKYWHDGFGWDWIPRDTMVIITLPHLLMSNLSSLMTAYKKGQKNVQSKGYEKMKSVVDQVLLDLTQF